MKPTKEEIKKVLSVEVALYDPDILYTCPECGKESTLWEWDKKTAEVFEGPIMSLFAGYDEDWREFCCPKCNFLSYDREIDEASGNDAEDPWSDID